MSRQHRRPLLACLVIAVISVMFMAYSVRAQALIGVLASDDRSAVIRVAHRALLGASQALWDDAPSAQDPGPRAQARVRGSAGTARTETPRSRVSLGKTVKPAEVKDRRGSLRTAAPGRTEPKHADRRRDPQSKPEQRPDRSRDDRSRDDRNRGDRGRKDQGHGDRGRDDRDRGRDDRDRGREDRGRDWGQERGNGRGHGHGQERGNGRGHGHGQEQSNGRSHGHGQGRNNGHDRGRDWGQERGNGNDRGNGR